MWWWPCCAAPKPRVVENATHQNPYLTSADTLILTWHHIRGGGRKRERARKLQAASEELPRTANAPGLMMGRCCHSTCEMGVACWALLDDLCAIMGCDGYSGSAQIGTVVICLTALLPYLEGWCKNSPVVTGEQWHPCLPPRRPFVLKVYTTTRFQNIALLQCVPIITFCVIAWRDVPIFREAASLDVTAMMMPLRKRTFRRMLGPRVMPVRQQMLRLVTRFLRCA